MILMRKETVRKFATKDLNMGVMFQSLLGRSDLIQSYPVDDSCNIFNGEKLAKLGTEKNESLLNI